MNLRKQIAGDLAEAVKMFTVHSSQLTVEESDIEVTRPANSINGDYSTNLALKLSHDSKQKPADIAKKLADSIKTQGYLEKVEVAGPGFINFFIKDKVWQRQVGEVIKADDKFGSNNLGKGKKARVEFVSANPTGPLHFGNARGGPIGDSLASVLEFSGYKVLREYYHNDMGVQVEKLGQSILDVAKGKKLGDQEYKGEYIKDLVKEIGKVTNAKDAGKKAVAFLLKDIIEDLSAIGIKFDNIQAESQLISSGKTKSGVDLLQKKKALKEKDGAIWFAPHDKWLEDRETVVVKSDGDYTYFANDIAYHKIKFQDNPDLVVDVFGSNHHGHVPRLQAVIERMGFDIDKFKVILYQWVRIKRGEEIVKMSKRSGNFVTVREVLDESGKDALRFFILMHDVNTHIDFDLDLAKEKSNKNPVYYVQYAHARIASILAWAKSKPSTVNCEPLTSIYELALIKKISRLPELVEDITDNFAVNQLTTYATELADAFHKFYENVQVLTGKKDEQSARLALINATQIALKNTLSLLGVSAPNKM